MTIRIISLLRGCTFIMILNRNLLPSLAHPCKEQNLNGTLKAYCSGTMMSQNDLQSLNANIQCLDLSKASIDSLLTASSFSRYKNLKWLSLRETIVAPNLKAVNSDPNVFKSLENLEELDISGLKQIGFPKYNWPPNIKILKINNTGLQERLDANDILKLEYVDVSNNEFMTKFPIFNPKAPVKRVLIMNAKLEELTVKDFASNCRINTLEITIATDSAIWQPAHYCDCIQVQSWIIQFHILMKYHLICGQSENRPQCETKFDDGVLALRRACIGEEVRTPRLILLFCVLFLFALMLTTIAFAYRYANLRYHIKPISASKSDGDEEVGMDEEGESVGEDEEESP